MLTNRHSRAIKEKEDTGSKPWGSGTVRSTIIYTLENGVALSSEAKGPPIHDPPYMPKKNESMLPSENMKDKNGSEQ